jgi:hypothetical protein
MQKFGCSWEKKGKADLTRAKGHNERAHPTASQLPEAAWFTKEGMHVIQPWDNDLASKARGLAKRKDAVVGIEFTLQVGNQTQWRELPDALHPCGKPMAGSGERIKALVKAAKLAAYKEFGKARIISIVLHTDESTPHVQIIVAPILDDKLAQKHWIGGIAKCEQLRERLHKAFSDIVPCVYERGGPGGEPLDKAKAAGGPKAPQPAPAKKGFIEKLADARGAGELLKVAKAELAQLHQQVQTLFSQLKKAQFKAADAEEKREAAEAKAKAAERETAKARRQIELLQREVDRISPFAPEKAVKAVQSSLPPKGQGTGPLKPPGAPGTGLRPS